MGVGVRPQSRNPGRHKAAVSGLAFGDHCIVLGWLMLVPNDMLIAACQMGSESRRRRQMTEDFLERQRYGEQVAVASRRAVDLDSDRKSVV